MKEKEKTADFYSSIKKDMLKSEHKYKELFESVVTMLPENKITSVLDLGCGIGSLVPFLNTSGYTNYLGVDFASNLTLAASLRFSEYRFITDDISSKVVSKMMSKYSVIICLEVLEHMKNDLELIKSLPSEKPFIFSVPTVMSKGHVRCFASQDEVVARYQEFLLFDKNKTIMKLGKPHHLMFLNKTTRKKHD